MNLQIQDYAVYRDRHGRLDTMPIHSYWDDAKVYRKLQERVNYYTGPIEWLRVNHTGSPQEAIEHAFLQMEEKYNEEIREALKAVPPSERPQAARQIIIHGRPVMRQDRATHSGTGWHPPVPREYMAQEFVRREW